MCRHAPVQQSNLLALHTVGNFNANRKGKRSKQISEKEVGGTFVSDVEMICVPNGCTVSSVAKNRDEDPAISGNTHENLGIDVENSHECDDENFGTLDQDGEMIGDSGASPAAEDGDTNELFSDASSGSTSSDDDADPKPDTSSSFPMFHFRHLEEPKHPALDDYNPVYGYDVFRESEIGVDAEDPWREWREHLAANNGQPDVPSDDPVAEIGDLPAQCNAEEEFDREIASRVGMSEITSPMSLFSRRLQEAGYGEVSLPGPLYNLDNEIHPIFRLSNWFHHSDFSPKDDDLLWQRIQPALRLASLLIKKNLLPWWVRLFCGERRFDKSTGKWYLVEPQDQGAENIAKVEGYLRNMADRICWMFWPGMRNTAGVAYDKWSDLQGETDFFQNQDEVRYPPGCGSLKPIVLNSKFRAYFLSDHYSMSMSPCKALSTQWYLAFTMLHELAHAFWFCMRTRCRNKREPVHDIRDGFSELGVSWETSLYGDVFINGDLDIQHGMLGLGMQRNFRSKVNNAIIDNVLFRFPVDPLWIHSFFIKATWTKFNRLSAAKRATFWHHPDTRVAVINGPQRRFDDHWYWMWLSSDYPDTHRLSVTYWLLRLEELIKRQDERKTIRAANAKVERRHTSYSPGKKLPEPWQD